MSQKTDIAPAVFRYMPEEREALRVKVNLPQEKIDIINRICESFGNDPGELINVLHEAQHEFGYLPAEVQDVIAHNLKVSVAHVYGVVTFYTYFTMIPKGEFPISICTGTACYVRGAEKVLEEFKKELRCVGACGLAPVVLVGERVYGRVSPDGVKNILDEYRK